MKMNPRLLNGKAKIILGSLFALILISTFLFFLVHKTRVLPQSTFEISFQNNKFNFSSNLLTSDKKNIENFLNKLGVAQNISKGFSFELDSTSSAKLAFSSPINGGINITDSKLEFNGTTSHQLIDGQFTPKNFKIPQSVQIQAFGANLHSFVFSRLNISPDLNNWVDQNFKKDSPEYLLIFDNADIALLWPNPKTDFTSLKEINLTGDSYKEEIQDDITYYLYKLPKDKYDQQISLSMFNIGDFSALVTNQSSAKEIVRAIKTQESSQNFTDDTSPTSFYIKYENTDHNLDVNLKPVLFGDKNLSDPKEKIFQTVSKLTEFKLTLKENSFSGLINW